MTNLPCSYVPNHVTKRHKKHQFRITAFPLNTPPLSRYVLDTYIIPQLNLYKS